MSSEVHAHSFSGNYTVPVKLTDVRPISTGMDDKSLALAHVIRPEHPSSPIRVIEKTIGRSAADPMGENPGASAEHYNRMHMQYRIAGLNVIDWTLRTDRNTLLMPDLTADGSALYGKAAYRMASEWRRRGLDQRQPHPLDNVFLALTDDDHFTAIVDAARKSMHRANQAGILLPGDEDAFELWLHAGQPENTWELITLDLAESSMTTPNSPTAKSTNRAMTAAFLANLQMIRAGLQGQEQNQQDYQDAYHHMADLL